MLEHVKQVLNNFSDFIGKILPLTPAIYVI